MECNVHRKKSNCGCFCPWLSRLNTHSDAEAQGREHSKNIDRQISRDKKDFRKIHRLLLLGAGESGKSTIIKQMQLIHGSKFSDSVRKQWREDIRVNLADAIVSILAAMPGIDPPVSLDNPENETAAKWVLDNATKRDFGYPEEFYRFTEVLWKDKGVQVAFERSNEYQLIDNAKYFLDRIDLVSKEDYVPTDQDILRCRVLTTGICELFFQVNDVKFQITDVGGQRDERRKWFMCFNNVQAIIFVTACSSYNMVLREDTSKNRLKESLELFNSVWNNRWLLHISIILFLNKQDLFREKILSGRSKLEDYFPAFRDFETWVHEPNEHPEVVRAKNFVKNEFQKISVASNCYEDHRCFPHFTCAVDTENIKRVFEDCREVAQIKYLMQNSLL